MLNAVLLASKQKRAQNFYVMKRLLVCLLVLPLGGCDQVVTKAEHEATEKKLAAAETKIAALESQPKHYYQLREQGMRTFRFDPDTGQTCIQLTSKADWKNPETQRSGCEYRDFLADGGTYAQAECFYANNCSLLSKEPSEIREAKAR